MEQEIEIDHQPAALAGRLVLPEGARAAIVIARGASLADQQVAGWLQRRFATLSLLAADQEPEALADALVAATEWLATDPLTRGLRIGYYASSTDTAAALRAAAAQPDVVGAIVCRGGRPDLAGVALRHVWAPTLLLCAEIDPACTALGQAALDELQGDKELAIVPGASRDFDEPRALELVSAIALGWFERHLVSAPHLYAI